MQEPIVEVDAAKDSGFTTMNGIPSEVRGCQFCRMHIKWRTCRLSLFSGSEF